MGAYRWREVVAGKAGSDPSIGSHWEQPARYVLRQLGAKLASPDDDDILGVLEDPAHVRELLTDSNTLGSKELAYAISHAKHMIHSAHSESRREGTQIPRDEADQIIPLDELPRLPPRGRGGVAREKAVVASDADLQVARAVEVELRLWRADEAKYGTRLIPQSVAAVLRSDRLPEPVVEVANGKGEEVPYTAAEYQEEAPGASILVCTEPTPAQVRLLWLAAEFGFPVEPRVAGEPWREIEDHD